MNENNDLLFAKLDDKIQFCKSKNKITHTDFFTEPEIMKIEKYLNSIKFKDYFFEGGTPNSDRKMLFFYPEKLTQELALSNSGSILCVVRITLPASLRRFFRTQRLFKCHNETWYYT